MALPNDSLSSQILTAPLLGGRGQEITLTEDKETGGVALNDPSQGLQVQVWSASIIGGEHIVINAPNTTETTLYTSPTGPSSITEVSLSFDQNMRPTFAFVENGEVKFQWFDSSISDTVITDFGDTWSNPRVSLDDKRDFQSGQSDVILAYLRAGNLYHRRQRDRYQTELLLATDVEGELHKIGMGANFRFQFDIRIPWSQERIVQETIAAAANDSTIVTGPTPIATPTIVTPSSPTIWTDDNEEDPV